MLDYIVVEGNIGAGKSTLGRLLAQDSGSRIVLEQFEDNSFLPRFYKDPERYAFPLEMSFLASRFNQLKNILGQADLFSRQLLADYGLFKSLIFSKITLAEDEFHLYMKLFDIIDQQLPRPQLVVYIHRPVPQLLANIRKRNREYEQEIRGDYLEKVHEGYMEYFRSHPRLTVLLLEIGAMDFEASPTDYRLLKRYISGNYMPGLNIISL
jgi:deoxyguanosine kinase